MNKYTVLHDIIISSIYRNSDISPLLKVELLSYLFFQLCWDFDYFELVGDLDK